MNKLDTFLSTSIADHKKFAIAFNNALKEIRAQQIGIDAFELSLNGDSKSIEDINNKSIYTIKKEESLINLPIHINNALSAWNDKAIVFRGTRLPDNSGSFDFDGIHTTAQIHIADGYAGGSANNSTGIGRLLNYIEGGFITSYEVPLSTPTYANFEFEDLKKHAISRNISPTLQDLKDTLITLKTTESSDFFIDENGKPSEKLQAYNSLVTNREHYETVLPADSLVESLYFRNKKDIIKLDLNNPQYDQLLTRLQEASLRDFYEIVPLEKLQQKISYIDENTENSALLNKVKLLIEKTKEESLNAPWEATSLKDVSLKDSAYVNKRPYIKESVCVGSTMDTSCVKKSKIIEELETIVELIRTNDINKASELLLNIENNNNKNSQNTKKFTVTENHKNTSINSVLAMRKTIKNDATIKMVI